MMDPAAESQFANWTIEEAAVAADLPVEHAALYVFGLQWPYASESSEEQGRQQLVEHYYYSAASRRPSDDGPRSAAGPAGDRRSEGGNGWRINLGKRVVAHESPQGSGGGGGGVDFYEGCKEVEDAFIDDMGLMKTKMHTYPACLGGLAEMYTVPRMVAIGPYHHRRPELTKVEYVKHVAAIHCIRASAGTGWPAEELNYAVASAADGCRPLYDKAVMAGIGYDDFRHMMFFDACFLVQYILMSSSRHTQTIHEELQRVLSPSRIDIQHDVMLLENQLPWNVVRAVMDHMLDGMAYVSLMKDYIYTLKGYLQDKDPGETAKWRRVVHWDGTYELPHLLGLVRFYIVARRGSAAAAVLPPQGQGTKGCDDGKTSGKTSYSVSAIELAEVGIKLTANDGTTGPELIDMGLDVPRGTAVFAKLHLQPLCLSRDRASCLVNMAALELCTVQSFSLAPAEDSAVCSYLLLLATMVSRVEDVDELRARGLLHGGGGLTNKNALNFFTSLQCLRLGKRYTRIMKDIEDYKENRLVRSKLHAFWYNNKNAIAAAGSGFLALVAIVGTLASIKQAL